MTLVIRKRGRPSKADIAAREANKVVKYRSDDEILNDLKLRFGILAKMTHGAVNRTIRSLSVTGAPGVGKTYTVESILQHASKTKGTKFEIVKGTISAVGLYKLGYRMRHRGSVMVLDDVDIIFTDEDSLNLLKILCDSSETRTVSWMKESNALKIEGEEDIPQQYDFEGTCIFISNLEWQKIIDEGRSKLAPHFAALQSRSHYLDLQLHNRQELGVWVEHIVTSCKIFQREGISAEKGSRILNFIRRHRDDLRELSIRTVVKIAEIVNTDSDWENTVRVLQVKNT